MIPSLSDDARIKFDFDKLLFTLAGIPVQGLKTRPGFQLKFDLSTKKLSPSTVVAKPCRRNRFWMPFEA